jgi:hypothetical protein
MTDVVELFPHQRRLVDEYRSGAAPRVVALIAQPGLGKTRAVAVIAADRAKVGGLVIIVTPPVLVRQWAQEVRDAGAAPVSMYAKPADLRLALEKQAAAWPPSGIVICSSSVVGTPLAARTLHGISPSLFVADELRFSATSDTGRSLRALSDTADQAIFIDIRPNATANAWYPAHEDRRWTLPLAEAEGRNVRSHLSVRTHQYTGDPVEAEIVRNALEVLESARYPYRHQLLTRPAIQSALLSLVRRLQEPRQAAPKEVEIEPERLWVPKLDSSAAEIAWQLLDRFDELTQDGRLLAVMQETRSAIDDQRPVIIVTELPDEADYVAAALGRDAELTPVVTARMTFEESLVAVESLRAGEILVVTAPVSLASTKGNLPDRILNIWFAAPSAGWRLQEWLGAATLRSTIEVALLKAVPPVTPADLFVDQMELPVENP